MIEADIEMILETHFRKNGGMGSGYSTIVAAHENGTILHYTANSRQINDGELVLIDAGAEYDYYSADISRTFPANGRFTKIQKNVYTIVLDAQLAAIESVKPGESIEHVHRTALKVLVKGLVTLKIIDGPVSSAIKNGLYKPFYMHGTSHFLGMDVHDVGRVRKHNKWTELKPGMVFTIEPGLYFPSRIKGYPKKYKGIAVRIEDNILVTRTGYRNLTPAIPKTIKEIEEYMK
jgi:Xaa-Pro aminopeptidase